jgi:hypothetical protein
MQRFGISAIVICLMIVLGAGFGNSVWGQCISNKTISTANDYGDNPLAESGDYDPCDNILHYNFNFSRTGQTSPFTIIAYQILQGSSEVFIYHADSRIYDPYSNNIISGSQPVGPSTQHNLRLIRTYGNGGCFQNIKATAQYKADIPD